MYEILVSAAWWNPAELLPLLAAAAIIDLSLGLCGRSMPQVRQPPCFAPYVLQRVYRVLACVQST